MKALFSTESVTLAANTSVTIAGNGYFRVYSTTDTVRVRFRAAGGTLLAEGDFKSGEWARYKSELIELVNQNASAITVEYRVAPAETGSDSVQLLNGTSAAPLYIREPWDKHCARNSYIHVVGNGNYTGMWLPPSADVGLLVQSLSIFGNGIFDIGYTASTDAAIASEGGWTSGQLGYAELGSLSARTASVKENVTAAGSPIMAAAGFSGPAPMGAVWHLPQKAYLPAGHPYGVVLVLRNVTGAPAMLGLSLTVEEV